MPSARKPSPQFTTALTTMSGADNADPPGLLRCAPSNRTEPPISAWLRHTSPRQIKPFCPRMSLPTVSRVAFRALSVPSNLAVFRSKVPAIREPTSRISAVERQPVSRRVPSIIAPEQRRPGKVEPARSIFWVRALCRSGRSSNWQSRRRTGCGTSVLLRSRISTMRAPIRLSVAK